MAVSISGTSGTWSHGSSVTISGSGFGTKPTAAPAIWDDCSGTNPLAKWTGAWPNENATYNLTYRAAQRGIAMPHSNIAKYMAGCHYAGRPQGGMNVIAWTTTEITSYPKYVFTSYYNQCDPGWYFDSVENNHKTFAFSEGEGPYNMPNNWYIGLSGLYNATSVPQWGYNDDTNTCGGRFGWCTLQDPDQNGLDHWWEDAINPMGGAWIKTELALKITNDNTGFIKLWENGVLKIDYLGSTDKYIGTTRTFGIGGYADPNNSITSWRYFADIYFDYSLQRVILANNSVLANATIREVQIPTAWSTGSVTINVNIGKFTNGQTAYLFVYDATGAANSTTAASTITINSGSPVIAPVASFNASVVTGQAPLSVTFTDTSSNTPTVWSWDFDISANNYSTPDTASTAGPHTVTYDYGGGFTSRLTVGNAAGSDSEDKALSVRYLKPTNFQAS